MHRSPDAAQAGRDPAALLREYGSRPRLVVYVAAAAGAGKTRRLLNDARRLHASGKHVVIGWLETKGRGELDALSSDLPRVPARRAGNEPATFAEFDFEAAVRLHPDAIVLDEVAHDNLPGSAHAKRWQDALALREAGINVLAAFNIAHLETVAAAAEAVLGYPVRDIVPLSFLKSADEVIAIDISPEQLRERLRRGGVVHGDDVERALNGAFREHTLTVLRELMLRTVDDLTLSTVSAASTSAAAAIVPSGLEPGNYLRRTAAVAAAFDLAVEVIPDPSYDRDEIAQFARPLNAEVLAAREPSAVDVAELRASLVAVPPGKLAGKLVNTKVERDIYVVGIDQTYFVEAAFRTPLSATVGDRMRTGYGKLTVYLGAAAAAGKTMAMLDRGHQLQAEGVDVLIGLVETHGRAETAAAIGTLESLPLHESVVDGITYRELDRDALLARAPRVALIDELAHTNAPGSTAPKRFLDVLAMLRAGIDVITTLNVQHLEDLGDVVHRLTGTTVHETLPDGILALAEEVILIDVSPETLRERLRSGKIYPAAQIDSALANFFRAENLAALRELAIREALRVETRERIVAPFDRLLLSVVARESDRALIRRAARLAARLEVEFTLAHVAEKNDRVDPAALDAFAGLARMLNVEWIDERADDAARRLLEIARARNETTIAVGGTLRRPRLMQRSAFARRLLDAGARELIVLARRGEDAAPPAQG